MIDQGHLRNGGIETQRETTPKGAFEGAHRGAGGRALVVTRQNRGVHLRKRSEDLKLLRGLIRPSLRHEKYRSFLFSRLDLLNRTDPGDQGRRFETLNTCCSLKNDESWLSLKAKIRRLVNSDLLRRFKGAVISFLPTVRSFTVFSPQRGIQLPRSVQTERDPSCRNPSSTTCSSGATSRSRAQRIFKNYDQPRPPLRFTPTHRSPGDRVGLVVGAAPRDDKIECRLVGFTRSAGNDRLKGTQGVSSRLASDCRSTTRPHGQTLLDNMTVVGALRKMLFKCRALMTEIKDLLRRPTTLLAPTLCYTNTRFVSRWSTFAARQIWQMLHREGSGHGPCSSPRHKSSCTCSGRRWDRRSAQTH
jgi:hypothetical protein